MLALLAMRRIHPLQARQAALRATACPHCMLAACVWALATRGSQTVVGQWRIRASLAGRRDESQDMGALPCSISDKYDQRTEDKGQNKSSAHLF